MILGGDAVDILGSRNPSTGGKVGSGKGTASRLFPRYGDIIEADGSARQDLDGDGILILEIGIGIGDNPLCSLEVSCFLRRIIIPSMSQMVTATIMAAGISSMQKN